MFSRKWQHRHPGMDVLTYCKQNIRNLSALSELRKLAKENRNWHNIRSPLARKSIRTDSRILAINTFGELSLQSIPERLQMSCLCSTRGACGLGDRDMFGIALRSQNFSKANSNQDNGRNLRAREQRRTDRKYPDSQEERARREKPGPRRRNPIPRRRNKKIPRRPSYVYHKLEHRLIEDKDDHQPSRTTTASGTLPWMSRLKRYRRGDTCKRAVPWVGARVAWINGSNAVRTPVSDPLERARVHAYAKR